MSQATRPSSAFAEALSLGSLGAESPKPLETARARLHALLRRCRRRFDIVVVDAPSIAAFTNPTTNSYRRLVPGFEAPINLAYSSRNRSASVRIPMYSPSPKAKRIEVRFPDPLANPYLAFTAMMMAGLDGIQRRLDPGQPLDKDIYALTPAELAEVPSMPASLDEALNNMKNDHEYLLKGDVFTEDLIETWIDYKMSKEVSAMRLRPHPYEFALYFDA